MQKTKIKCTTTGCHFVNKGVRRAYAFFRLIVFHVVVFAHHTVLHCLFVLCGKHDLLSFEYTDADVLISNDLLSFEFACARGHP
jgi:hypothetical protein